MDADRGEAWGGLEDFLLCMEPMLVAFARRSIELQGVHGITAPDVANAVIAGVLARPDCLPRAQGDAGCRRYLLRMVANEVIDVRRREGYSPTRAADHEELDGYAEFLATTGCVTRADQIAQLRALAASLPDKYRAILELAFLEGLDFGGIARHLAVERRVVRRRYERARVMLLSRLQGGGHT